MQCESKLCCPMIVVTLPSLIQIQLRRVFARSHTRWFSALCMYRCIAHIYIYIYLRTTSSARVCIHVRCTYIRGGANTRKNQLHILLCNCVGHANASEC